MSEPFPKYTIDKVKSCFSKIERFSMGLSDIGIYPQQNPVNEFLYAVKDLVAKLEKANYDCPPDGAICDQPTAADYIRSHSPEILHSKIYSEFLRIYEKDFWGMPDYRPALEQAIAGYLPADHHDREVLQTIAQFPCNEKISKYDVLHKYLLIASEPLSARKFWHIAATITQILPFRSGNNIYVFFPAKQISCVTHIR